MFNVPIISLLICFANKMTGIHMMGQLSVTGLRHRGLLLQLKDFAIFFPLLTHSSSVLHSSATFHIETSHLIYSANQMTGSYIKYNIGMKNLT